MLQDWTYWLALTLLWTLFMSFYSMQEMACISTNRLRLDIWVAQNKRWAVQLNTLLQRPSLLFSTTLIGVNVGMMLSSESSRRLFESLGYDPNLAPLVEIPFVLIFGELVPMFAARVYPEHAARLGMTVLYISSKLLYPINYLMDLFFRATNRLLRKKELQESSDFLSREELQKLLEEHHGVEETTASSTIGNIFALKNKKASQLMQPIESFACISSHATIEMLRQLAQKSSSDVFCVYHKTPKKIVGMIRLSNILQASDRKRLDDFIEPACFVTKELHAFELLAHLQEEEVKEAIVLSDHTSSQAIAIGVITLDHLIDVLFAQDESLEEPSRLQYLEKTVDAATSIAEFNALYGTKIDPQGQESFAELIEQLLGRHPAPEDTLSLDGLELIVKDTSLFHAKEILIRTKK